LKVILVLLDGCATCNKGGKITGLRVTHRDEDGGFFSKCDEMEEYEAFRVSELNIKVEANKNVDMATVGFSVPVRLRHRVCSTIFSVPPASDKYVDIKLHIEHT